MGEAEERSAGYRPRPFALVWWSVRNLVAFRGRASRTEWWLFYFVIAFASMIIPEGSMPLVHKVAWVICMMPITVRRLHDFNATGLWAVFLPVGIALDAWGDGLIPSTSAYDHVPYWAVAAILLPAVVALLAIALTPGDTGDNRHGPDPKLQY